MPRTFKIVAHYVGQNREVFYPDAADEMQAEIVIMRTGRVVDSVQEFGK